MIRFIGLILLLTFQFAIAADDFINQKVYVETSLDSDGDGKLDSIYVNIYRPRVNSKVPVSLSLSPYGLSLNKGVKVEDQLVDLLPQETKIPFVNNKVDSHFNNELHPYLIKKIFDSDKVAKVYAHSLGTGLSDGCPSVGGRDEAMAGKAVVEWLNGKGRAFDSDGNEVKADWTNGDVGMHGQSYDGTLAIMVATTGVKGLKAVVAKAAISNWYYYYRSFGAVSSGVSEPSVLASLIVRSGTCENEIRLLRKNQGRLHGDYSSFWDHRNYLKYAKNIKASILLIHGQNDNNVDMRHSVELFNAIPHSVPKMMLIHNEGHSPLRREKISNLGDRWFSQYVLKQETGIRAEPRIKVESMNPPKGFSSADPGIWFSHNNWPHEKTITKKLYFNQPYLQSAQVSSSFHDFTDLGADLSIKQLIDNPNEINHGRLIYSSRPLQNNTIFSGAPIVHLDFAVLNRMAANLTVSLVEYLSTGEKLEITRGWADLQNHRNLSQGELLSPGKMYNIKFSLIPKGHIFRRGSRIGIMITSTDKGFNLVPKSGTKIRIYLGKGSFVKLNLKKKLQIHNIYNKELKLLVYLYVRNGFCVLGAIF